MESLSLSIVASSCKPGTFLLWRIICQNLLGKKVLAQCRSKATHGSECKLHTKRDCHPNHRSHLMVVRRVAGQLERPRVSKAANLAIISQKASIVVNELAILGFLPLKKSLAICILVDANVLVVNMGLGFERQTDWPPVPITGQKWLCACFFPISQLLATFYQGWKKQGLWTGTMWMVATRCGMLRILYSI